MESVENWWGSIIDVFPVLGKWDLLDIFLVSFIVYRFLLFIKGTRAIQILFSLVLLALFYWGSYILELRTARALLSTVFDNVFIIFVVIFQHDIRRVLSQVGKTPFFRQGQAVKDTYLIEELVKTAVSLANKKIGALIVIERQADVSDFCESGTSVDAHFSKEMLTSIFLPVSPLHDGAVVIRKGRIHMAGCFLPLTLNTMTSKTVGTRHRAALGLTEETDAVCLVVSEENGTVSVASAGRIVHDLDGNQLRKTLVEYL